jgi:ribosome-binding protein aMBF1 (putative translation factor)
MGLTDMEEANKRRCWMCGAEIQARHLGSVKIGDSDVAIGYCERCNAFGVPIGEDEKTYRERMADAKRRVPKGWSMRQCEDGSRIFTASVDLDGMWTCR